jgi:hypothetical protein
VVEGPVLLHQHDHVLDLGDRRHFRDALSADAGASSRSFRSAGGRAIEPRTIPPADAISWRRDTSIVKPDLLAPEL